MTMTIAVTERDHSTSLETLRANGRVPAIIYGPAQTPVAISLEEKSFDKIRKEAGEATVLSLTGLSKPVDVLIKHIDFNPIKQRILHVDLYALEKGKEITTHVPLHFIGVAPVEEMHGGSVTKVLHEVTVSCQPADLPSHLDVDLSVVEKVEDKIHVSDLVLPPRVTVTTDPEETVVVVTAAKQTPAAEGETAIDMSTIEVEKKGKEGQEQEEGK